MTFEILFDLFLGGATLQWHRSASPHSRRSPCPIVAFRKRFLGNLLRERHSKSIAYARRITIPCSGFCNCMQHFLPVIFPMRRAPSVIAIFFAPKSKSVRTRNDSSFRFRRSSVAHMQDQFNRLIFITKSIVRHTGLQNFSPDCPSCFADGIHGKFCSHPPATACCIFSSPVSICCTYHPRGAGEFWDDCAKNARLNRDCKNSPLTVTR